MTYRTPAEEAKRLHVSRATISTLIDHEGMPAIILRGTVSAGGRRRRIIRLDPDAVDGWLVGRRNRQLRDWSRYQRRGA